MNSNVPYLAVSEFEEKIPEEILQLFKNDMNGFSDEIVKGKRKRYSFDLDGYSYHVELILQGMGMEKYYHLFEEEDISVEIMISMNEDDLLKLGITDLTDRETILKHLKEFRLSDHLLKLKKDNSTDDYEEMEDYVQMMTNTYNHLIELNSYLDFLQNGLSKYPPCDYLICNFETGLNIFKFIIKHGIIQSNRISNILYGEEMNENNLITQMFNVSELNLTEEMMEKLRNCQKESKSLNKNRLITTVLLGVAVIVAVVVKMPKRGII